MNEAFQSDLTNFDLVVLGGGLAGITAARQAARSGMVTALVCNQIGGNYLHKGCMEARYLHENAKTIRYCASARHKGIVIKGLALDMIEMMRRKKDQIDRIESDMEAELRNLEETSSRIHVFEGIGRALPNGTMDVMDRHKQQRQITWQKLIVATGSLPTKREFLEGFNEVLTDEEILFSESQSRIVVTVKKDDEKEFLKIMGKNNCVYLGETNNSGRLTIKSDTGTLINDDIEELKSLWQNALIF